MARFHINDKLQNFRFHLLDISWNFGGIRPFVFSPLAGFSSVSSPEFTLETDEIQDGVSLFKYVTRGKVGVAPIVLSKGLSIDDSSFWKWFVACATRNSYVSLVNSAFGFTGERRNLLLIQFMNYSLDAIPGAFDSFAHVAAVTGGVIPNFQGFNRLPGRAWVLYKCLPTRYKPTGDLDASSSDISISELEVRPHFVEELTWL